MDAPDAGTPSDRPGAADMPPREPDTDTPRREPGTDTPRCGPSAEAPRCGPSAEAPRCGPLDLSEGATPSAGELPREVVDALVRAAARSPAYDGPPPTGSGVTVLPGHRTLIKVQHRRHETLAVCLEYERVRVAAAIPAPALLDHGEIVVGGARRWWTVLERVPGSHSGGGPLLPRRQRAVTAVMRRWHDHAPPIGRRLDAPGSALMFFGEIRLRDPSCAARLAAALDQACRGAPMTAIHGDMAVGHNVLFTGARLRAVLDPGAIQVGPPMLDLAWCIAVDLGLGGTVESALAGYGGGMDHERLDRLLPLMLARRRFDLLNQRRPVAAERLTAHLRARRPELLGWLPPPDPVPSRVPG
ncbi:phosphotransferase [Plantactinospora sp. WMMB782]|uniref:phosphotransferase n=1 Tax=Plantactinospora sp. WMMB782 TaxID=3404121 RepID=UPI003B935517